MAQKTSSPAGVAATPSAPWSVKLKFLGIGLLVGLAGGGIGAGKIYLDKSAELSAVSEKLSRANGVEALLGARAAAAAASVALRQENYGDAKEQLTLARARLDSLDPASASLDAARLDTIRQRLDSVNVASGTDSTGPVKTLDEVGLALDRLLLPTTP